MTAYCDGMAGSGEEEKATDIASLDLSEVFYPVSYNILMDKIRMYSLEKWTVIENSINC